MKDITAGSASLNIAGSCARKDTVGWYISALILLFVLVFRVRYDIYDLSGPLLLLAVLLLIKSRHVPAFVVQGTLVMLFLTSYVLIVSIFAEPAHNPDALLIAKFVRATVSFLCVAVLIWWLTRSYGRWEEFRRFHYMLAGVLALHPVVMVAQLSIPELNIWMADNLESAGHFHVERARGLANGTSSGGAFLGFIGLYYFYLAHRYRSALLFVGALCLLPLYPASALAGLAPWSIGALYWLVRGGYGRKKELGLLFVGCAGLVMLFALSAHYPHFSVLDRVDMAGDRLAALVGDKPEPVSHGDPRRSLEKLKDSVSLPAQSRVWQWVFGNAHERGSARSFQSDMGWVRFAHVYGILGTFLMIGGIVWFGFSARAVLPWLFILAFLVLQFKNHYLFGRMFFDLFFVWFSIAVMERLAVLRLRRVV